MHVAAFLPMRYLPTALQNGSLITPVQSAASHELMEIYK